MKTLREIVHLVCHYLINSFRQVELEVMFAEIDLVPNEADYKARLEATALHFRRSNPKQKNYLQNIWENFPIENFYFFPFKALNGVL